MSYRIRKAIERLLRTGQIDSPAYEAKLLLQEYYGNSYNLRGDHDSDITELPLQLKQMINRRVDGEPLQHILGKTSFYGLELKCDHRALVPRQDSETVVDVCLELIDTDSNQSIADIGTGSGCILLALLSQRANLMGIGIDISEDAISLAKENSIFNDLHSRTTLLRSDWSDWDGWKDCSLIVCNPPYIASDQIPNLAKDVRDADPRIALDGGNDGLSCIKEVSRIGRKRMKPRTWLVLEIGYDQGVSVPKILKENNFTNICVRKDLSGHDRVVVARR